MAPTNPSPKTQVGSASPRLSVVIVTWRSAEQIGPALVALGRELRPGDELIVIDNASGDGTAEWVQELAPEARLVRNSENLGFVVAVNQGAALAEGDLLVLLNPDAEVGDGWRDGIERPWIGGYGWGAWQALITSDGGNTINSDGNEIHFTGICWAGRAGRPIAEAHSSPHPIGYASGACLAVPLALWRQAGGFPERLFMYGDDVDISLGLRLRGYEIGLEPSALVEHDYEFDKGGAKWRYLERSRWALIVRNYPGALLAAVAPALLLTELALHAVALAGGWLGPKLRADLDLLRWLPGLVSERRRIQAGRRISAAEFARHLSVDLDSEYLPAPTRWPLVSWPLRAYWWTVRRLLGQ